MIELLRADRRAADRRQHGAAVAAGAAVVIMVLLALFTTGVALLLASANVFYHDVNYLWGILAQILFYATPVIYDPASVGEPWLTIIANYGPTGASSSPCTT